MKKILLLATLLATSASVFAQGVVNFNNKLSTDIAGNPAIDFRIYLDTVGGAPVPGGLGYRAALYGAVGNVAESSLSILTEPGGTSQEFDFRTSPVPAGYGYLNVGSTPLRGVPGAGYGALVTLQVRAWGGGYSTYEQAVAAGAPRGKSNLIQITTSTGPTDPNTPRLVGMTPFAIVPVPEPSSIALGLLGLGAVALIRRRK